MSKTYRFVFNYKPTSNIPILMYLMRSKSKFLNKFNELPRLDRNRPPLYYMDFTESELFECRMLYGDVLVAEEDCFTIPIDYIKNTPVKEKFKIYGFFLKDNNELKSSDIGRIFNTMAEIKGLT